MGKIGNPPPIALIFQLLAVDKKRIVRKIGRLEASSLRKVEIDIKNLLQLK